MIFCIVTRQRFDLADAIYISFDNLRKKSKKGTLMKSSISYPSLMTEMCRVHGILPPPGAHYGRRTIAITQAEIRDDFVDSPSCFQWHRQHYGPRGCAGW